MNLLNSENDFFEPLLKLNLLNPKLISDFKKYLLDSDDKDTFRINPYLYSQTFSEDPEEVLKLFLHSTHIGLLDFNWNMICSCCGGYYDSFKSMKNLQSHFFCTICSHETSARLDNYIQVSFSKSNKLSNNKFHNLELLNIDEFIDNILFSKESHYGDLKPISEVHKSMMVARKKLEKSSKSSFSLNSSTGNLEIHFFFYGALSLKVEPQGDKEININITKSGIQTSSLSIQPNQSILQINNEVNSDIFFFAFHFSDETLNSEPPLVQFKPFLSAKKLLSNQTFRELFRYETISQEEGLSVKDITILFTDLKGSTELYDNIGDLKAFSLVKQHFEVLKMIIDRNKGAIVKTIGDSVMAIFEKPIDSLKASLSILKEIRQFNERKGIDVLQLKIGFHSGDAIAVASNDKMDYFGQNVNIAARVQGLAGSQEIYFTDEVYREMEIQDYLKEFKVNEKEVYLKGVKEKKKVYSLKG